jgi:4-amino-4-deoxy-L-arabinose transferase-like glycosyltransferase
LLSNLVAPRAGFLGWALALWVATAGQVTIVTGGPIERARVLYLVAMAIAIVSSLTWPPLPSCKLSAGRPAGVNAVQWGALGLGAALALLSVPLTVRHMYPWAATSWIVGVVILVVTCVVQTRPRITRPSTATLALIAITLAAFVLRVVGLTTLPPEVHGDEAAIGNSARRLISGDDTNLFGLGWYAIDEVSFGVSAAFMRVFGNDLFGLRMASAVEGTLSVTFTFLLTQRLFGLRTAILASCLLSVAEMHLHYSRTGFTYIQACLTAVLLLYLMLRALERRGLLDYVLFGLVGGLSLLVYAGARLAPVVCVLFIGHALLRERMAFVRAHAVGLVVAVVAALVFMAPMAVVYSAEPASFNVRVSDISVLSGDGLAHELSAYEVSSLSDVLRIQVQKTLEAFVYSGETSQQYAHPAPLLDPWTGALFVVGVAAFTWRLGEPAYFLVTVWLWLSLLLGSVLTVDAPFSPHLVVMLPLLGMLPAMYLEAGWRTAERLKASIARPVFAVLASTVVVLALIANVRDYTEVQAQRWQPAGFATVLSRYVVEINALYRVYLVSRPDTSINYETIRFLAPDLDAMDLHDSLLSNVRPPNNGKGMAFIVEAALPTAAQRLAELRERYPGGQETPHLTTRGNLLFTSYLVPAPDRPGQ